MADAPDEIRKCFSDPGPSRHLESQDFFAEERAYVAQLAERANQFRRGVERRWPCDAAGQGGGVPDIAAGTERSDLSSSASSSDTATANQATGEEVSTFPKSSGEPAQLPKNPGSRGHPLLCMRPCAFLAQGACADGEGCGHCHGEHRERARHFDKLRRKLMRSLSFQERVVLALPVLRQQADQHGLMPMVGELLDMLEQAGRQVAEQLGEPSEHAPMGPAGRQRLAKSVTNLGFLTILRQVCQAPDTPEWFRGEGLRVRLRELVESNPSLT